MRDILALPSMADFVEQSNLNLVGNRALPAFSQILGSMADHGLIHPPPERGSVRKWRG